MAGDTYTMTVGSNIKQVTKDIDGMTAALDQSTGAFSELNDQVNIQKSVLIDLEKEYVLLKAKQDAIPKGSYYAGMSALNKKIKDSETNIKLEKIALKDLNHQRGIAKKKITDQEKALKKKTAAQKKGNAMTKTATGVSKKLGLTMKLIPIMIIVTALKFLWDAMMKNKTIFDAVTKVTTIITNLFSDFVSVIVDTYNWVTESSDRFDALGKVMKGLVTIALTPLKLSFYALKLGVQALQLAFYKLKDLWPGNNESANIRRLENQMKATNKEMQNVAKEAIQAGKDIVNNVGEAATELGAIYNKVSTGIKDISIDSTKRVVEDTEAQLQATKDAAAERLQAEKDNANAIAEFRKSLNDKILDQQADTDEKALELARKRHLAELDLLKLSLEERNELEKQINASYDADAKAMADEKAQTEAEILKEMQDENMLAEIEDLVERAEMELQIQYDSDLAELEQHDNFIELKMELDKKLAAAQQALDEKKKTWDNVTTKEKLTMASNAFGQLSSIMGKETKAGKAAAIGQATIQTYLGATSAFTSLSGIPIVGPALGVVAAGAAVVAGFKNIQAIKSGGGGAPPPAAPPPAADTSPKPEMMSGAFDSSSLTVPQDPVKAYVVTDEMTNSQSQLANIRQRSTI